MSSENMGAHENGDDEVVQMVTLESGDGELVQMPISHAIMSGTIDNMLSDIDDEEDSPIPIPNVSGKILRKIPDFCKNNSDVPRELTDEQKLEMRTKPLEGWNLEFVNVPLAILFEMILAANFLDIPPMLDVCCKAVAEMIKGKTPQEIKKIFGVEGEFTEEEKRKVLIDNPWLESPEEETSFGGGGAAASE